MNCRLCPRAPRRRETSDDVDDFNSFGPRKWESAFDAAVGGSYAAPTMIPHGRSGRLGAEAIGFLAGGYLPYLALLDRGPVGGELVEAFHRRVLASFDAFRVLCVHRTGPFGSEAIGRAVLIVVVCERVEAGLAIEQQSKISDAVAIDVVPTR